MHGTPVDARPDQARRSIVSFAWLWVVIVGIALSAVTNFVLPDDHGWLDALYLGTLACSTLAMAAGTFTWSAPRSVTRAWRLMAVGMLLYLLGEATWIWYARRDLEPFPSVADAFFLAGVASMITAAFLLARTRRDRSDVTVLLDTVIAAVSVGAVLWTVSIGPYIDDPDATTVERLIAGAYPLLDVFLVAIIARIVLAGGRLPVGFLLPVIGLGVWSITDIAYYQQELRGTYREWAWVDFGYMVGFVVAGASSLHRGAARVCEVRERPPQIDRLRIAVLAVFATIPIVMIGLSDEIGAGDDVDVLAVASAIVVVLVVARTWTLISLNGRLGEMRSHARFTAIIRNTSDAVIVYDDDRHIVYASPALDRKWGWGDDPLEGRPIQSVVRSGDGARPDAWLGILEGGAVHAPIELLLRAADGTETPVSVVASDLRDDPDISGVVLTARDISHRRELESKLRHDAAHDALTGLLNRGAFCRRLDEILLRQVGDGSTIVYVDVDDFKEINDQFGHGVGDRVLTALATILASEADADGVVGRLGGDEFAAVVERDGAPRLCDRMRELAADLDVETLRRPVTVSIGCYDIEADSTADEALRRADLAMYESKRGGKGKTTPYSIELDRRAQRRIALRTGLALALPQGELHLAYQDIVRVSDGARCGREALLRWESPELGTIEPSTFVPLAEETGLIRDIGAWVLRQACEDALGWRPDADLAAPLVSVNVSPIQLQHDFADLVATVLAETGLDADRLQLELTESVITRPNAADTFHRIRDLGARLAIDDFGSGYCSLGYLQQFHVDTIKIDRALVTRCDRDPRLLAGVVRLVNSVGAAPLAEGVETDAELATISELGIQLAQGFLWHRPAPLVCDSASAAPPI